MCIRDRPQRAVERDPGHHPSVGEVLAPAPGLPESLTGLVPVVHQPVEQGAQRVPALDVQVDAVLVGEGDAVECLAVDVQLQLGRRTVAYAYRGRSLVPLPVLQGLFVEVGGTVHPVHDVQRSRVGVAARLLLDPVAQPADERPRLIGESQPQQGVHGEGRVTDPGEPVVPVALAAQLLRQSRRGGRHQGAAGGIRHQLQCHGGAFHRLAPPARVPGLAEPRPPVLPGVVEEFLELGDAELARRPLRGGLHDQPALLSGLERE